MTKAELSELVYEATQLSKKEATAAVETVFDLMKETLISGETLKLAGFGSFLVNKKTARKGRNPHTGEELTISPRRVVTFKASNLLKQSINQD